MNYYINPMWFYWMHVIDGVKITALVLLICSIIAFGISLGIFYMDMEYQDEEYEKKLKRFIKFTLGILVGCTLILIFAPSSKTIVEMMIAKNLTEQNVQNGIEAVKGAVDYIVKAIQNAK